MATLPAAGVLGGLSGRGRGAIGCTAGADLGAEVEGGPCGVLAAVEEAPGGILTAVDGGPCGALTAVDDAPGRVWAAVEGSVCGAMAARPTEETEVASLWEL